MEKSRGTGDEKRKGQGHNRFWLGAIAGAFVTAFAGLLIVGMSAGIYLFGNRVMTRQPGIRTEGPAPSITDGKGRDAGVDLDRITSKMNLMDEIIGQYFLYEENPLQVEDFIYRGMLEGLDDPYSAYYTAADYRAMQEGTKGIYSGIGAMVSQNKDTGLCSIMKVFAGTPAMEAGMKPGDVIYKINGRDVTGESLDVLVGTHIKGKPGSKVRITVLRSSEEEYRDFNLTRRKIEVPTVEYRMLDEQTGYLAVSEFDVVTVSQFKAAVEALKQAGMKGLIIDLRNNPGGILDSAVQMADYLLPDDNASYPKGGGKTLLLYTADKNGKGNQYTASDGHQLDLPMAVLINGHSASASEVFAGALRDYDSAFLVGTVSYGKGIVQNLIPLGDGSAMKITTAHYYTPSGFDLHGKGIKPDIQVELDEAFQTQAVIELEKDNQVRAAAEALRGRQ